MKKAAERELLMEVIRKNPGISTIRDAREYLLSLNKIRKSENLKE